MDATTFQLDPNYAGGAGGPFDNNTSDSSSTESWYQTLLNNSGDILKGSADLVSALNGHPSTTNVVTSTSANTAKGNNVLYIVLAVVFLLVIVFILLKK